MPKYELSKNKFKKKKERVNSHQHFNLGLISQRQSSNEMSTEIQTTRRVIER